MVTQEELEKMSPEEITALQKQNCIFCKIIKGEIPSKQVYEDDKVISILDIRPASKGHLLIMPKEHYPILPLIPPDVFQHMFKISKILSMALKKATLCEGVNLFIASGGVAGQQSPHFLFHLIPREKEDGLDVLNPPENPSFINFQKEILPSLKNNLTIMLNKNLGQAQQPATPDMAKIVENKKEQIAKILEENKEARDLLRLDPEGFSKLVESSGELKPIFEGVDLFALSKQIATLFPPDKKPKAEVFLGEDPLEQKNKIFAYFDERPKAKDLLIEDVEHFKELLSKRDDVQKLFENVDVDKLSEKLKEVEE